MALNLRCSLFVLKQNKTAIKEECTWQSGKLATMGGFLPALEVPGGNIQGLLQVLDPQDDEELLSPTSVA